MAILALGMRIAIRYDAQEGNRRPRLAVALRTQRKDLIVGGARRRGPNTVAWREERHVCRVCFQSVPIIKNHHYRMQKRVPSARGGRGVSTVVDYVGGATRAKGDWLAVQLRQNTCRMGVESERTG